ncbi:MAG: STM4012 family radical SAM protein [Myxococcales bacterium]|nr:STM4012 family radical SAM protein [Myxococcales bacterium]
MRRALEGTPYAQYVYGYPHKTAYRALAPPRELAPLWAHEFESSALRRDALFLYVHVPFCEMRCGFCNLFTTVRPEGSLEARYLEALARQASVLRDALGDVSFARLAIGGGTPTWLDPAQLEALFAIVERTMGARPTSVPVSVETSPETATDDRLAVLEAHGVDRVSIGVQSFFEDEAKSMGRPQKRASVEAALDRIRARSFSTLNIDLIYGASAQTPARWVESLALALRYAPEELYLYPLYVRPMTGLAKTARQWDDERLALYRLGRDYLCANGYEQRSMRMFRRANSPQKPAPPYACQSDGMVGLGCGARSYTSALHYSEEWAVGGRSVREILDAYVARDERDFAFARYGVELSTDEQRRRAAILSLLSDEGLAPGVEASALEGLSTLRELGFVHALSDGRLALTAAGLERADAIGPALFSEAMAARMETFSLR